MLDILKLIPVLSQLAEIAAKIEELWDASETNADFFKALAKELPAVAEIVDKSHSEAAPATEQEGRNGIAAALAFSPAIVAKAQAAAGVEDEAYYGPKTKEAVKALQAKLGVAQDGWWGKTTEKAIADAEAAASGETTTGEEATGEEETTEDDETSSGRRRRGRH